MKKNKAEKKTENGRLLFKYGEQRKTEAKTSQINTKLNK